MTYESQLTLESTENAPKGSLTPLLKRYIDQPLADETSIPNLGALIGIYEL